MGDPEASRFIACTAWTGSPSTNSVLAQDSGASRVEENTILGIAVKSGQPGFARLGEPRHQPLRRRPHQDLVLMFGFLLEPRQVLRSLEAPQAWPAVRGRVPIEGDEVHHQA
jgi:hypothetical protein